jgi:hypothetical protein
MSNYISIDNQHFAILSYRRSLKVFVFMVFILNVQSIFQFLRF